MEGKAVFVIGPYPDQPMSVLIWSSKDASSILKKFGKGSSHQTQFHSHSLTGHQQNTAMTTNSSTTTKADGLKLHCLMAFHGSVVAYYAIVDFHMLLASIHLLQIGHPITKMFLGGSTQFYTTWNQVFHQIYFVLSLVQDILTYSSKQEHIKFCTWFDDFKQKVFVPVMLPSTFMTMINFWSIYWAAPHLILAYDVLELIPPWLNHAMHTFITPIILTEMLITSHGNKPYLNGFKSVSIMMSAYAAWLYPVSCYTNQWPYPFLEVMNLPQHLVFFIAMYVHGYFWFNIFRHVENYISGSNFRDGILEMKRQ